MDHTDDTARTQKELGLAIGGGRTALNPASPDKYDLETPEIDHVAEERLVRKLDLHIIPMVMLVYLLPLLDRVNIGNARLYGLKSKLELTGSRFQIAVSILFVTYILSELPSNLVLKKLHPSRWIAFITTDYITLMMAQTLTFSEATQAVLTPFDLDGPVQSGYRRLRRAAVSGSSDDSTWNEPIDIPIYLHSLQTLRFVGFKKSAAEVIHDRYHSALIELESMPINFYDFMTGYLEGKSSDAYKVDHDWDEVLKDLGIRKRVRMGILNPEFDDLRLTKSAKDWALETIEDGWIFLTGMNNTVKRNEEKLRIRHSKPGSGIAAKKHSKMESEIQQTGSSAHPTATDSPTIIEDDHHIVLYKGGTISRLRSAISSDEDIILTALRTVPPSDFSAEELLLYLTKRQCAYHYAEYAHTRNPEQDAGIFQISVPKELLIDSRELFGSEWQDLVFASRGPKRYTAPCREKELEYEKEHVLIGPICGVSNKQCEDLIEPSQITPLTLKTGIKASQHVITSTKRIRKIGEACRGRVMIEVTREKTKTEGKSRMLYIPGGLRLGYWLPSNLPRYGKRTTGVGMQLTIGNINGVMAPFLYGTNDGPRYTKGHAVTLAMVGSASVLYSVMTVYFTKRNSRRIAGREDNRVEGKTDEEIAEMGDESLRFLFTV